MAPTDTAPREAARTLVHLCPADLWGLHTSGAWKSDTEKRAAWKWLDLVVEEFGSVTEAVRVMRMDDLARRRIAMLVIEGRTTEQALVRNVATARKALGFVSGLLLPPPSIPGDGPASIRRRVRWIRVWHYDGYLSKLADDLSLDRSYVAHFLMDEHRNLTPAMLQGFNRLGIRPSWIEKGEGTPWKGAPPDWIDPKGIG